MAGPDPVPPIKLRDWAIALCERVRGRAGAAAVPPLGSVLNPLSMEQAKALFKELAENKKIPFNFPREYCFARAHEMRRLIVEKGIECMKVFNLATDDDALVVKDPRMGLVGWVYHVAPTVSVQTPDGNVRMVIDPSLFKEPVTIEEWRAVQNCPDAPLKEVDSRIYQPPDEYDDDYSQTEQGLKDATVARDTWREGAVPMEGDEEDEDEEVAQDATKDV